MLSENPQRNIGTLPRTESGIRDSLRSFYERCKHIGFKNRIDTLEYSEDSFETSAGINVLLWQLGVVAIGIASELHKHEIPDFKEPFVTTRCGPTLGAICRTLVDVNLGTGTARTGGTAGRTPPVIGVEELNAVGMHPDLVAPNIGGFLVGQMAGHPKEFGIDPKQVGDHVPGHRDGLMLEIVTKREVAEHFEERKVSGIATDLFKIGILTASSHTLLHRGGPIERRLLLTKEVRLERHHAGNSEKKVRIMRDEAGRGNNRVASGLEERGEGTTQLVRSHRIHGWISLMTGNRAD